MTEVLRFVKAILGYGQPPTPPTLVTPMFLKFYLSSDQVIVLSAIVLPVSVAVDHYRTDPAAPMRCRDKAGAIMEALRGGR